MRVNKSFKRRLQRRIPYAVLKPQGFLYQADADSHVRARLFQRIDGLL